LSLIANYLEKEVGVKVNLIGIQPLNIGPTKVISEPVAKSIDLLENMLSGFPKLGD
jgi:hypothetical protein